MTGRQSSGRPLQQSSIRKASRSRKPVMSADVANGPAVSRRAHETGVTQHLQMSGGGVLDSAQPCGDLTGRDALVTGLDQQAEHFEARLLSERGQCGECGILSSSCPSRLLDMLFDVHDTLMTVREIGGASAAAAGYRPWWIGWIATVCFSSSRRARIGAAIQVVSSRCRGAALRYRRPAPAP